MSVFARTYVRSQHDRGLLGGCHSHNLDLPGVWGHGVGDIADDFTGESLLAIGVDDREGDRVRGVGNNSEVAVIPAIGSTMQSVVVVVLVRENVELLAVDLEGAVLDAVGVTAGYTTEMGMHLALVVNRLVEAKHDVALNTILASDEKVGDRGAIRNEARPDTLGRDLVLAIGVRTKGAIGAVLRKGSRRKQREESRGPHGALVLSTDLSGEGVVGEEVENCNTSGGECLYGGMGKLARLYLLRTLSARVPSSVLQP
jgi:hypothetical protein